MEEEIKRKYHSLAAVRELGRRPRVEFLDFMNGLARSAR